MTRERLQIRSCPTSETHVSFKRSVSPVSPEDAATITVNNEEHTLVQIRATGDIILDVEFENSRKANRSIPKDALRQLRAAKEPVHSTRVLYRVRLDTLKKNSKYFAQLLGSDVFCEGREVTEQLATITASGRQASELPAAALPRIQIKDDEDATRTYGRESVFRDLLQIMHGAEHLTKIISLHYLTVLVVMADRYDCLNSQQSPANATNLVSRYYHTNFKKFKYPATYDRSHEESLRQKILVFYHTQQDFAFTAATKEFILRGSMRWNNDEADEPVHTAIWWQLPEGLEAELEYRRERILRTIAQDQTNVVQGYIGTTRQCQYGYADSVSCDSFQLGEAIKFLVRKNLFSLTFPDDPTYVYPAAYQGDIQALTGLLRQCPEYQIDKNHHHCGIRTELLAALNETEQYFSRAAGLSRQEWQMNRQNHTWQVDEEAKLLLSVHRRTAREVLILGKESQSSADFAKVEESKF